MFRLSLNPNRSRARFRVLLGATLSVMAVFPWTPLARGQTLRGVTANSNPDGQTNSQSWGRSQLTEDRRGRPTRPLPDRSGSLRGRFTQIREVIDRFQDLRSQLPRPSRDVALAAASADRSTRSARESMIRLLERQGALAGQTLRGSRNRAVAREGGIGTRPGHARLIGQTLAAWLDAVEGVPRNEQPDNAWLSRPFERGRELSPADANRLDRVIRQGLQILKRAQLEPASPATSVSRPPTPPPEQTPPKTSGPKVKNLTRNLAWILPSVLLGCLALGNLGRRVRGRNRPLSSANSVAWIPYLAILGDAMGGYGRHIHRIKNILGVSRRYDGDPEGLADSLADRRTREELESLVKDATADLEKWISRATPLDLARRLEAVLRKGCRILADIQTRLLPALREGSLPIAAEDLARTVGEIQGPFQTFAESLCELGQSHTLDPRDVVETALAPLTFRDKVRFETRFDSAATGLVPDAPRCRRELVAALTNLLENAHTFSQSRIDLTASLQPIEAGAGTRHQMVFTVEDDGTGVNPDIVGRLFRPHVTDRPDGTGMGLFTVYEIARTLEGSVRHDPEFSGGARFILEIPVY